MRNYGYNNRTISIDVDVSDIIGDINTTSMLDELTRRGFKTIENEYLINRLDSFKSDKDKKELLFLLFDLKEWQGKERLLEEINNLF